MDIKSQNMEAIRQAVTSSYMSARAAEKQKLKSAFPTEESPGPDEPEAPPEEEMLSDVDEDDYILDRAALSMRGVPDSVAQRLISEYVQKGGKTSYRDSSNRDRPMEAKFIRKFKLAAFPKGFYFQHVIADECQLIRNPWTGFSRLVRLLIKMSYRSRADKEENPSSLLLVSATPAINQITDYRGLSSLF
jgi:hypothetical protein